VLQVRPPIIYEPGSWGPAEAQALVPDGWAAPHAGRHK